MRSMNRTLGLTLMLAASTSLAADPWADTVVEYTPGDNLPVVFGSDPPIPFDVADAAVGQPTRDSVAFGGYAVSPFSSAADVSEVVALGEGGSLTVAFDEPVTDDPLNPFGIDLLVFGNSFYTTNDFDFDEETTVAGVGSEGGVIEVSSDGVTYYTVPGVDADGAFPTNGYADSTTFFPGAGAAPADFTLPVDPGFDPTGLGAAETIAGYAGSAGGAGIDLALLGLSEISFVRVTNPIGSLTTPEIDGFADVRAVPEPTTLAGAALACLALGRRRIRG